MITDQFSFTMERQDRGMFFYSVGDVVAYRSRFLRDVGMYVNVPRNGKVTRVRQFSRGQVLDVQWCDGTWNAILAANVIHKDMVHKEPN